MRVTEGKATNRDRWVCAAAGMVLSGVAAAASAAFPAATGRVVWLAGVLAAAFVLRQGLLSFVVRFCRVARAPNTNLRPSFTFIIPCLNELPTLYRSVPAMKALSYDGELTLLYICESASTDGSLEYLQGESEGNPRISLIEKDTAPAGRGAAVACGVRGAPDSEVVGFLDADHVLDQPSLNELARLFGQDDPPPAVQGHCETLNESPNALVRLLTTERHWLERVELLAGPRLGAIRQFGGGQGFFRTEVLKQPSATIDEGMILDDTDLSVRMALDGRRIEFSPHISTRSLQPETFTAFFDQRFRWTRGWLQLARKYFPPPLRSGGASFVTRLDLLRLVTTPVAGLVLWVGFVAAAVGLTAGGPARPPLPLAWACLLWPLLLSVAPFLAGTLPRRLTDLPLVLAGIPLLTLFYTWVCAAAVVDVFLLRRAPRYGKTAKRVANSKEAAGC